jgi:hypothetical protein
MPRQIRAPLQIQLFGIYQRPTMGGELCYGCFWARVISSDRRDLAAWIGSSAGLIPKGRSLVMVGLDGIRTRPPVVMARQKQGLLGERAGLRDATALHSVTVLETI